MKKILLVIAAVMLCASSVSAKSKFVDAIASQKWSLGLRVGGGLQADAECFYGKNTYVEGRLGMSYIGYLSADFQAFHNWNCCNWNWTPSVGKWYLDAGVGINLGGRAHWAYGGVAGQVKFGLKFKKVPIRLAVDYSPVLGVCGWYYGKNVDLGDSEPIRGAGFYTNGFANFGVSATYCF